MSKRTISVPKDHAFLDIISHPRGGPGQHVHFSSAQIEQIARTVRHAPEVVIKVLPKDSNNACSIRGHINYIGRKGQLDIETDDGRRLGDKDAGKQLLDNWDLDLEATKRETEFSKARGRRASKLAHKLVFSMPPGTQPKCVLTAVRNFALEKFALQHRYAMVLHTDEPHPHVHVVVKAISEQGVRLNISKDNLREWRARFAHYLRQEGIAANATDRFMRGETTSRKPDGMYRAANRGDSNHMRRRSDEVTQELEKGRLQVELGKEKLLETRSRLEHQWKSISHGLRKAGHMDIAREAELFITKLPPPDTDKERLIIELTRRNSGLVKLDHDMTR